MKCIIFGAAPVEDTGFIQVSPASGDIVICADGGYRLAKRMGIKPDWIVGDFDSFEGEPVQGRVIRVDPVKDHTDLYLAVEHGIRKGYRNFHVYGALGGRFDHSIAAVQMLHGMITRGIRIRLYAKDNEMFAICNEQIEIEKNGYRFFSLFSLSESCEGLSVEGAAYPLEDAALSADFPLGVSNEITGQKATVTVKKGILLVVFSNDSHKPPAKCIG